VLARPRLLRREDDLGYLLGALKNTFLLQQRTRSRRPRQAALSEEFELEGPRSRGPQEVVERREVFAVIAALPDEFRDVLVAVDVTGLSYEETAQALKIPVGTVMSRLYRARQQVVRQVES
jgi:RNA polymerase sigma-70 factor (ECF subfamily)